MATVYQKVNAICVHTLLTPQVEQEYDDDDEYDEDKLAKVPLTEKYVKEHLECIIYLSKLFFTCFDEFIHNEDSFIQ